MSYEERLQILALKLWPVRGNCAQMQMKEKAIQTYHLKKLIQELNEQSDKAQWMHEKERSANIQR